MQVEGATRNFAIATSGKYDNYIPIYDTPERMQMCFECQLPQSACDRCPMTRKERKTDGEKTRSSRKRADGKEKIHSGGRGPACIDKEKYCEYYNTGLSDVAIGKKFGVTKWPIVERRKKSGFPSNFMQKGAVRAHGRVMTVDDCKW